MHRFGFRAKMTLIRLAAALLVTAMTGHGAVKKGAVESPFEQAAANGRAAAEGLERCHRFLHGWLAVAEPTTGLIPRNLVDSPYWNGKDSAADNYPFMVLSAWFTDRPLFGGRMREMLFTEERLTKRPGWLRLTDDYGLEGTPGLRFAEADARRIFLNSAEYVKDGLLALTEWLGPSPWSNRMFAIIDDSFALAAVETPFGKVPIVGRDRDAAVEINGDYLQSLSRLYWMSGRDEKYLRWATRLGDLYLLPEGRHHPTRDFATLRLRDHGCEIISGLCELYVTLALVEQLPDGAHWAEKRAAYRPHLYAMLDRILEVGLNEHGMPYSIINPQSGEIVDPHISDGWGYLFDGYLAVALVDGVSAYREAALRPLDALNHHYRAFAWQPQKDLWDPSRDLPLGSQDGYADAIESALNLAHRIKETARAAEVFAWIDREIRELWSRQRPDGVIEGWHGDGNFARTTIMYCLWKSQGLTLQPWRPDVRLGAVIDDGVLKISLTAGQAWRGILKFDYPRHAENLRLPVDWPRINQFPEWYTVRSEATYEVRRDGSDAPSRLSGADLRAGLPIEVQANEELRLSVNEL